MAATTPPTPPTPAAPPAPPRTLDEAAVKALIEADRKAECKRLEDAAATKAAKKARSEMVDQYSRAAFAHEMLETLCSFWRWFLGGGIALMLSATFLWGSWGTGFLGLALAIASVVMFFLEGSSLHAQAALRQEIARGDEHGGDHH